MKAICFTFVILAISLFTTLLLRLYHSRPVRVLIHLGLAPADVCAKTILAILNAFLAPIDDARYCRVKRVGGTSLTLLLRRMVEMLIVRLLLVPVTTICGISSPFGTFEGLLVVLLELNLGPAP